MGASPDAAPWHSADTGGEMSISLQVPDSVVQAIRLPEDRIPEELLAELAVALYEHGFLSFGKSRELACLDKYQFGRLLGVRGVARHYGEQELEEDLAYAGRQ